jgi:hypothetical protein
MEVQHKTWSLEVRQQKRITCERLGQGNHLRVTVTVAVTVTVEVEAAATETGTVAVEVAVTGNALSVGSVTPSTSLASPLMVTTVTDFNTDGMPGEALECQPVGLKT